VRMPGRSASNGVMTMDSPLWRFQPGLFQICAGPGVVPRVIGRLAPEEVQEIFHLHAAAAERSVGGRLSICKP